MALHKAGLQPWSRAHVFRDTYERGREESTGGFPEQMEPGLSLFQRPDFQLMSESAELYSCKKILKFRRGGGHTAHDFVASDAGKHDAISLRGHTDPEVRRSAAIVAGSWHKAAMSRFGRRFRCWDFFRILPTDVDVPAGAATFFFNLREIGALVPVGFGAVIHRERVEPRGFGSTAGDDGIGHADNGRRVSATREFGENGPIGTKFALDGCGEDGAEVLLVFGIRAVPDFVLGVEIPIFAHCAFSGSEKHG